MGKIIVVGSMNMDIVIKVPYIPAVGETILADEVVFSTEAKVQIRQLQRQDWAEMYT